ncbi:MAG: universal stress protein [Anaerolineae bacterium]|jgi:nucleotide-binding universal stress UspA family protein
MTNRILVPLDGSSLAEQSLSCAVTLARELPAEVDLIRVIWVPPDILDILNESNSELNAFAAQLEADASEYLAALVGQLEDAGLHARHAVRHGPPADTILAYSEQAGIDQIVMATHGYSGIKRWTHGSVAERVLQAARVPLLLARVNERVPARDWRQPLALRRILVPLDGSSMAEQILPTVTTVARSLHAELILFQVPFASASGWMAGEWYAPTLAMFDTAEEVARIYLESVADRLEAQELIISTAMSVGPVATCIVQYAEANKVDLIAMCTHGRTGLARWALGSVADRVLRAGTTPILLVRAQ